MTAFPDTTQSAALIAPVFITNRAGLQLSNSHAVGNISFVRFEQRFVDFEVDGKRVVFPELRIGNRQELDFLADQRCRNK